MAQRLTVAGFATSGVLFGLAGLLPTFRGERLNVAFFVLGIVFIVLAIAVGAAVRKGRLHRD